MGGAGVGAGVGGVGAGVGVGRSARYARHVPGLGLSLMKPLTTSYCHCSLWWSCFAYSRTDGHVSPGQAMALLTSDCGETLVLTIGPAARSCAQ